MKKFFMFVLVLSFFGIFMSCKARDNAQPASTDQQASGNQAATNDQQASGNQAASTAQEAPKRPEFIVIDTQSVRGSLRDRVRLHNKTSRTGISFTVYLRDPKDNQWIVYGKGDLKGPGDTEFINSKLSGDLEYYRYFAIQPQDLRNYRYDFEKTHNDLYIYIYDK